MGKFKVGDRVRFLSSKGGGVIRSFAATNVANVEDDSGFEIPTLVSDLILEYCQEAEGTIFASPKPQEEIDKTKSRDNLTDSRNNPTKSRNNPTKLDFIFLKQRTVFFILFSNSAIGKSTCFCFDFVSL